MTTKSFILNSLLSFGAFATSFYLAWQLSANTNFMYAYWYEVIDIRQTIEKYGPYNKNRREFETTTKIEQVRLFSEIVYSIQNQGRGLQEIEYRNFKGEVIDTFLTPAEIIHLTDVANLVSSFRFLIIFGMLLTITSLLLIIFFKSEVMMIKQHLIGGIVFILIIVSIIVALGPTKIFYAGHELIFPDDHQWFFYYEDSLMSTMMKAPILFGPIAIQLLLITIIFWIFLLKIIQKLESKLNQKIDS